MPDVFMLAAVLLLATLGVALMRAVRGPGRVDRIMAAQLVATGGVGVALVLGAARNDPSMLDAVLIGTLLASVAVSAYVRGRTLGQPETDCPGRADEAGRSE